VTAPLLVVQNSEFDPPARLAEWFDAAGIVLDQRRPYSGDDLPEDLAGFSGLLVLGGEMAAWADDAAPWLAQVRHLIRTAVADARPTLGICLGAQLIAHALGGRVEVGADGPELGAQLIAKRSAAAQDPLLAELPITPDVVQWHYDAITQLPPDAVLLASSPVYPNQIFRVGRACWGMQPHFETTPDVVRAWVAKDRSELLRRGWDETDLAILLERAEAGHADIAQTWSVFIDRFVEALVDPSAIAIGAAVPVSTAAPIDDPAAIRAALAADLQAARQPPTSTGPVSLPMPGRRD
jgi:GMP synthase-like glutamine amidotransferase